VDIIGTILGKTALGSDRRKATWAGKRMAKELGLPYKKTVQPTGKAKVRTPFRAGAVIDEEW
jgi:hypothetical protein